MRTTICPIMAEIKYGDLLIDELIEAHPLVKTAKRAVVLREFSQILAMARLDDTVGPQEKNPTKSVPKNSGKPARPGFGMMDPT